ncbi:MAG: hypothetical protein KDA61_10700 [Planctomycetales bacterium]|nr:hypothetical protein [Planctomycetales bacterium]
MNLHDQRNGSRFLDARRIERQVLRIAQRMGLVGDPYADFVPEVGTLAQERTILEILISMRPRPRTDEERRIAGDMARSIVLTHNDQATAGWWR